MLSSIEVRATFIKNINTTQYEGECLNEHRKKTPFGNAQKTTLNVLGVFSFKGRICLSRIDHFIQRLLTEFYGLRYYIHLGVTKMEKVLKQLYWCPDMKKIYWSLCLNVKIFNK